MHRRIRGLTVGELPQGDVCPERILRAVLPGGDQGPQRSGCDTPSVQFGKGCRQRRGLEAKSEELRTRRLALLPGESDRFDVHVAESNASGRDAFSWAHQGPRNGKLKDFSEEGVDLRGVIRPDHDVVDSPDGRCSRLRGGVEAGKGQQDRRREKGERSSLRHDSPALLFVSGHLLPSRMTC